MQISFGLLLVDFDLFDHFDHFDRPERSEPLN